MPFYAVRRGTTPGVYPTWDECKEQVHGYAGARFKKFSTMQEAVSFVNAQDDQPASNSGGSSRFNPNPYSPAAQPQSAGKRRHGGSNYSGASNRGGHSRRQLHTVASYGYADGDSGGESDDDDLVEAPVPKSKVSRSSARVSCSAATEAPASSAPSLSKRPVVFTDGACVHNGNFRGKARAGVGVHWPSGLAEDLSEPLLGPKQSNQRAEMMAAYRALGQAYDMGLSAIELCSDSMYTIRGINEWVPNWKKRGWKTSEQKPVENRDLWELLDSMVKKVQVKWTHVRGHRGIWGNEKADELARQGMNMRAES